MGKSRRLGKAPPAQAPLGERQRQQQQCLGCPQGGDHRQHFGCGSELADHEDLDSRGDSRRDDQRSEKAQPVGHSVVVDHHRHHRCGHQADGAVGEVDETAGSKGQNQPDAQERIAQTEDRSQ